MTTGRRPTVLERRRRQARLIAVLVALAMIALVALPLIAVAQERAVPDAPVPAAAVDELVARTVGTGTGLLWPA